MLCLDDDKFHATSNCVDFAVVVESLEKSSSHVEGWDEICNERIVWWCLHRHHNRMKSAILASTSITLSFIMSSTKWHLQNPFWGQWDLKHHSENFSHFHLTWKFFPSMNGNFIYGISNYFSTSTPSIRWGKIKFVLGIVSILIFCFEFGKNPFKHEKSSGKSNE